MPANAESRLSQAFDDRAEALGHFFRRAGDAPRLVAYNDQVGCPLHNVQAALEWTLAVGILSPDDLVHAARLSGETAAAMVERKREGRRIYLYLGPRMDAPPADPYEGSLLYDEPGVRAYEFAQKPHAHAHFLRATQGAGSVFAMLSRRAPELRHVKRWLAAIFQEPAPNASNHMLAGWFSAGGGGVLFVPASEGGQFLYEEVGIDEQ